MARPKGSRDKKYDERREELILLARRHLASRDGRNASWRELAAACGVTVPTMNHYFGSRPELVDAVLAQARQQGDSYLKRAAVPSGPFAQSVTDLVMDLSLGFSHGVLDLQVIGLGESFAHEVTGPAFLNHQLEPIIDAIKARLQAHMDRGEMIDTDARYAAIALLSPMLVAHLHQSEMGGSRSHPMSLENFARLHAEAFVHGFAAPKTSKTAS